MKSKLTRLLMLFFLAPFIFPSLSWADSYSVKEPWKYRHCKSYDALIKSSVERWYPPDMWYPYALRAQLYQESLCKSDAVSHVGARGVAQFMPATWREMEARFGYRANPHDDIAVEWGAYYMRGRMKVWKSKRTNLERWELGLAGYNAGTGNILKAQRLCHYARLWRDIHPCLYRVTGHHHKETIGYVRRIRRHWRDMTVTQPWERHPQLLELIELDDG